MRANYPSESLAKLVDNSGLSLAVGGHEVLLDLWLFNLDLLLFEGSLIQQLTQVVLSLLDLLHLHEDLLFVSFALLLLFQQLIGEQAELLCECIQLSVVLLCGLLIDELVGQDLDVLRL